MRSVSIGAVAGSLLASGSAILADRLRAGAAPWHGCRLLLSRGAGSCWALARRVLPVEIDACERREEARDVRGFSTGLGALEGAGRGEG